MVYATLVRSPVGRRPGVNAAATMKVPGVSRPWRSGTRWQSSARPSSEVKAAKRSR